jgi:hypothetical protein
MAIKDCVDEIRKAAGDDLTDSDIADIAADIQRRARVKSAKDKLLSDYDALSAAAEDFAADADMAAKMEARNKAINVLVRKRVYEFADTAIKAGLTADKAIEALNVGTNRKFQGARLSVDARQKALIGEFVGGLIGDLERDGLLEFFSRRLGLFGRDGGVVDRDIARALWSIGEDGKVTADVHPDVKKIAEIVNKWQEVARLRSNRAGSFVRRIPGYIMRQAHDMLKIRKAGAKEWTEFVRPLLDADKTFGSSDPAKFLDGAYQGLSSGIHLKSQGATDDLAFKGPGNLAKRISQERILHFKDADSFLAYNEKFGTRSLIEGIFGGLERSAKDIGLMETWGTNPRAMFDDVRGALAYDNRSEHPDWAQKLRGKTLENQFAEIDGSAMIADDPSIAQFASGIRAVQSMAKLGGSVISSISDVATAASELRFQGQNLGPAYTGLMANFLEGRSSREARVLASDIGVGIEGALGSVMSRFSSDESLPGAASKIMRLYFKANLLTWWTDSIKTGVARMMSARAAGEAARGWSKVDPKFREALSLYGIDDAKWEVMRKATARLQDGKAYLTAQSIRDLPDEAFAALGSKTGRQAQGLRDELSSALQAFYTDRTDVAVVTPGAKENAMLHQGTLRGTWLGEATRFIMQFKAFPIAFATKVMGRDLGGEGLVQGLLKGKGDLLGIAHTVAATTAMGMIALQAKEVLKGRSPRDAFEGKWAETWRAAMLQGGGMGIYGDYFFGDFSRMGSSPEETFLGPTAGTASDIIKLWSKVRSGDDPSADAIRLGVGNAPFMNLFYTRAAMDYLVLYHLQEMANPGYLKRMEDRVKKENDQTFLAPPSQYAVGQ